MAAERSPLLRRGPLALLSAEVVSSLGTQMTFLALPWFVLTTTGSTSKMTLVLAAEILPTVLLGIPSGTVVARLGARTTMLLCDLMRAPLMVTIPVLHAAGALSLPVLLLLVAALGCFLAPYFSAQRVILPELVGEDVQVVSQANAVIELGTRLTILLGPVVAGLLIAGFDATSVLYIDAATFALSFLVIALLVPQTRRLGQAEETGGVLAGLRFVLSDRLLAPILATGVFISFFGQGVIATLPVLAYQDYDGSSRAAGLMFGAIGAGSLLGGLAAIALVRRMEPLRLITIGLLWIAVPRLLLAFELPLWGVLAVLFFTSIAGLLVNAPLIGLLTTRTPERLRAKVMTATITIITLAHPLGLVLTGRALDSWSPQAVLLISALGQLPFAIAFAVIAARQRETGATAAEPAL